MVSAVLITTAQKKPWASCSCPLADILTIMNGTIMPVSRRPTLEARLMPLARKVDSLALRAIEGIELR